METTYFSLASKKNFNMALRHFYKVTDVVDDVESNRNLADVINKLTDEKEIETDQILPIVGSVIRDKFGYSYDSYSIPSHVNEFEKIVEETYKWTALDIVIVYFNPYGRIFLINPKNSEHWDRVRELSTDQLAVIYVKDKKNGKKDVETNAINAVQDMLAGRDVFSNPAFIDETAAPRKPEPEKKPETAESRNKRVTPKYAVRVSNELFHNGNVEAWKKIIESYKAKFTDLDVYIYHEGELINDINALFKWGKVKHGDSIFFQVAGDDIKGVSKLQKYLFEGASPRFEQFLKIGVGKVLNLF